MIVHYENSSGEEKLLKNIIALQNIDDDEWEAITNNNKSLRLFTSRIEMILDDGLLATKENKK
jgi:hypothetical protein